VVFDGFKQDEADFPKVVTIDLSTAKFCPFVAMREGVWCSLNGFEVESIVSACIGYCSYNGEDIGWVFHFADGEEALLEDKLTLDHEHYRGCEGVELIEGEV